MVRWRRWMTIAAARASVHHHHCADSRLMWIVRGWVRMCHMGRCRCPRLVGVCRYPGTVLRLYYLEKVLNKVLFIFLIRFGTTQWICIDQWGINKYIGQGHHIINYKVQCDDYLVVVFCKRLCPQDSRSSALMLEGVRHSRCSFGFLNSITFLLWSRHRASMHSSWPPHDDDDADKARDCGDDVSSNDSYSDGSSCAVVLLFDRRRSNRRRRRPCNVPISHDASNLSADAKSEEKKHTDKEKRQKIDKLFFHLKHIRRRHGDKVHASVYENHSPNQIHKPNKIIDL